MPASMSKPVSAPACLDGWDDFLVSGTQIARELSSEMVDEPRTPKADAAFAPEDFEFDLDADELAMAACAVPTVTKPGTKAPWSGSGAFAKPPGPAKIHSETATPCQEKPVKIGRAHV